MTGRGARLRGLGLLGAVVAAVAGPPVVLVAVVGNPLPGWPLDLARAVEAVSAGAVPGRVWVDVAAVAAWGIWGLFTAGLVVEGLAVARRRPSPAGTPRWVRRLAQAVVAAAVTVAGPAEPGWAAPAVGLVPAAAAPATETGPSPVDRPLPAGMRAVTVAAGDSWSGFASTVLGDPDAGRTLRELNTGRDVGGHKLTGREVFVEAGWQLLLPQRADATAGEPAEATWEVGPGDHFWGIAEATLTDAWGRAPSDGEVAPYWNQVVDVNRDRLVPPGDPDVIVPGQVFDLPPVPANPAMPRSSTAEQPRSEVAPEATVPTDPAPAPAPPRPADPQQPEQPGTIENARPHRTVDEPAGSTAARDGPASDDAKVGDLADPVETPRTVWGVPAGLAPPVAATGLLAAGVVAAVRWRRRRALAHRAAGWRLPTPAPAEVVELDRLQAAAPPEAVLDELALLLCSLPAEVDPPLVELDDDGTVTVLFDEDQLAGLPDPLSPWQATTETGDGELVGWQARLGAPAATVSVGLPLLATLGRAGTATLVANVAGMRTLTVTGDRDDVRRWMRNATLEAALSRTAGPVEVTVAGDGLVGDRDGVRTIDDPEVELAAAVAERDAGVVADDRVARLVFCHAGVAAPPVPAGLGRLVGVVIAEVGPASGWALEVQADGTGRLRLPDDGEVDLVLPEADPEVVEQALGRFDQPAEHPEADDPTGGGAVAGPAGDGAVVPLVAAAPVAPAWCEVQLLGSVRLVRDGQELDGITPTPLELAAFLATHRDGVTLEQLLDAVWCGQASRSGPGKVRAALARLRGVLGDGPDGRPLLPRRESATARVVLSEHVGSDVDRALGLVAAARTLPEPARLRQLTAALEPVRGAPFADLPVSWASEIVHRTIAQLQDAALEVATARRDAGDFDGAVWAIERGLALCDPCDPLYVVWGQVEAARGRHDHVEQVARRLWQRHRDGADEIGGWVSAPAPDTQAEFETLLGGR